MAMVLSVLFLGGTSASAEVRNQIDPEDRFDARIEKMTERHNDFLEQKEATFQSKKEHALVRQSKKLDLIALYAPELHPLYADAFTDHIAVHEDLHATHIGLREEAFTTTIDGLIALKEELFPLAQAGTMTYREVAAELRQYLEDQRASYQAIRETYAQDISDLNTQNDANKVLVDALKADLRAAIAAADADSANGIIHELYEYLLLHIQYDNDKLEILNTISF